MSFRRQRDAWDDFLKRHGVALRECGIPAVVVANKQRFLIFLRRPRAEQKRCFGP
jgi:hypothetical protein